MDIKRLRELANAPVREERGQVGAMSNEEIDAYMLDLSARISDCAERLNNITPELGSPREADEIYNYLIKSADALKSL